ncbi:MAG: DUF6173 family protein [Methylovulum sp.]|nr:DUF6173 family protein [Methylovulum sp.]
MYEQKMYNLTQEDLEYAKQQESMMVDEMEQERKINVEMKREMDLIIKSSQIPKDQNLADEFYTRLITWINNFHRSLDDEHEVGCQLVNFGQTVTFHIDNIGCWNPSLISFQGKNEKGEVVELIQHVSQISILLVALQRENISPPKRPIGFASWAEYDENISASSQAPASLPLS